MLNQNSPLQFLDPLPKAVDVVVIGGGIIGISTAWFLTQRGVSVAICEKGRVAGEQSSRNWGWIRQHGRDAAELPIVMESLAHWAAIAESLREDIGFARCGVLYLAQNEQELAVRERWLAVARTQQLDSRMLSRTDVARLINESSQPWVGGAYTASDARAEPFLAVPALARDLHRRGVSITENCAVRNLDIEAGAVAGVVTEKGVIKCARAICAGGAWASMFCRNAGQDFPQLTVRATVARTAPAKNIFAGNAAGGGLAIRRRLDGGYTLAPSGYLDHYLSPDSLRYALSFRASVLRSLGEFKLRWSAQPRLRDQMHWSDDELSPFESTRVLDPKPNRHAIREIRERLGMLYPSLAERPLVQTWAGMIDTTPDVVPVMDRVPGIPGFFLAAGFSGHGFGIGPGAGRVMADMIVGRPLGHDVSRFRFSRFSDGSKLQLGPAL